MRKAVHRPRPPATHVDPYREHLRRRRAEEPAVPVTHLLEEIRELDHTGSANVAVRSSTGAAPKATAPSPPHAGRLLLTGAENLRPKEAALRDRIAAACLEMTALADLVRAFATC